jgi:hypothetical protein
VQSGHDFLRRKCLLLTQSGHSPQSSSDQENTNGCDAAPVIDPLHLTDHEATGGPIYVPQTLPAKRIPTAQIVMPTSTSSVFILFPR